MATIQQTKSEALAIIDAALTILDKFPDLSSTDINVSANVSANPFNFLLDAFKNTAGYNILIEYLSKYIATALPALELAVKGILMTNMKNLISCSINPYISDELLLEGLVFDLKQLDVTNILKTCPLDKKLGSCYYFGCDDMETTDEVKNSEDFNCLLWYMKNKSLTREVWGMTEEPDDSSNEKLKKTNGIITLEYTESSMSLSNAEGSAQYIQTPYNNCLHVFIGNAKAIGDNGPDAIINSYNAQMVEKNEQIETYQTELLSEEEELEQLLSDYEEQTITEEEYNEEYKTINENIETLNNNIEELQAELEDVALAKQEKLQEYQNSLSDNTYRGIERNYYYRKTLVQFNYDYIFSLKLFDEKVVTAMLIDSLTGCLSINLNLSYSQKLVQNETKKIIQQIIETDDATVSDCFFTFSNDDYNAMLETSESIRSGLLNVDGVETSPVQIDTESLLSSINSINSSATKQEIQSTISGNITEITASISNAEYEVSGKTSASIQLNIIEQLMSCLAYSIVMSIISPKVYLLLLVNLKTLGQSTDLALNDFLAAFRNLMTELIRKIRDELVQYLVDELMKLLQTLAADVATRMAIEQAAYYTRLIKKLIECMKSNNTTYDWQTDEVGVDIYDEDKEPETTEC